MFVIYVHVMLTFVASPLFAGEPTDRIRNVLDQGFVILNDPDLQLAEKRKERIEKFVLLAHDLFDFREVSRRVLGPEWRDLNREKKDEFVEHFTKLLKKTYAGGIDLYNGEKVKYAKEFVTKGFARVHTKVIDKKGQEYSVKYTLLRRSGNWKVYDVEFERVSLVGNYKAQFLRVIRNSGFNDLMKKLREKTD